MTDAADQHDEPEVRQVRPRGIPRAMMLEIIRRQELQEQEEQDFICFAQDIPPYVPESR